uniref:Uncharacterized protein n=1 Tax=Magallana gigas TaxID=29159 RepID=A0A8W8M885_MAGGI
MATKLISSSGRVTAYLPNLRAAVQHFRGFASYNKYVEKEDIEPESRSRNLGVFGPGDKRFPLPGKIGVNVNNKIKAPPPPAPHSTSPQDLFKTHIPEERHSVVIEQLINQAIEYDEEFLPESEPNPMELLECVAQPCPQTLRRDVQELFPSRDMSKSSLTVITISHRTTHAYVGSLFTTAPMDHPLIALMTLTKTPPTPGVSSKGQGDSSLCQTVEEGKDN